MNSYEDALDGSELTHPRRTQRRSRRDSIADFQSDVPDGIEARPPRRAKARPRLDSAASIDPNPVDGSEVAPPKRSKRRSRVDAAGSIAPEPSDGSEITAPRKSRTRPRSDPIARSDAEPLETSEIRAPKRSKRRTRPDSLASLHPESPAARPESYASTRPSSYLSTRPRSYADTEALTNDLNEKSEYDSDTPKRINAELLRRYDDIQTGAKKTWWTRRRKIWIGIVIGIIALIIIIVGAVVGSRKGFQYTPSYAQVNNTIAFENGGGTHQSINVTEDGIGAGQDVYTYYQGDAANFPDHTRWVSFGDMWNANLPNIKQSCGWLGYPPDNSADDNAYLFNAIQDRANASLVDHRYILAVVLQESHGCVNVGGTTSSGGVKNPGLMQSHDGDSYVKSSPWLSILLMIQDGVQGTKWGDGLVQLLNIYGDPYKAARAYNSGFVPTNGDLSAASGATACYVSDIANRLTGWVNAKSTCPGDDAN